MNQNDDYDNLTKIILVGDAAVGKTHFLSRFVKGCLPRNTAPTIGVEFANKMTTSKNGQEIKLQIWDTAGQQRYRGITHSHYKSAHGAFAVYDVTKQQSFENLQTWIKEIQEFGKPDIVIMLVGNKVDLVDKTPTQRVSQNKAKQFAIQNKVLFAEISTVTNLNVDNCFARLISEIVQLRNMEVKIDSIFHF